MVTGMGRRHDGDTMTLARCWLDLGFAFLLLAKDAIRGPRLRWLVATSARWACKLAHQSWRGVSRWSPNSVD